MAAPVEARVAAVRIVSDGLTTYERGLEAALASARADLNRAQAEFQVATAHSQSALDHAAREEEARKLELDRCQANCEELARAHELSVVVRDQAKSDWERHKQALAKIEQGAGELLATIRTVQASSSQAIPRGRKHIQEYGNVLEQYLGRGA